MSAGNELLLYRVNFCERPVAPSLHSLTETLRVQRVLALGRRLVGADPPRDYSGPPYQGRGLLAGASGGRGVPVLAPGGRGLRRPPQRRAVIDRRWEGEQIRLRQILRRLTGEGVD